MQKVKYLLIAVLVVLVGELVKTPQVLAARPVNQFTTFQITTDSSQQNGPLVWGNTVVWTDWRGPNGLDIYKYDLFSKKEILLVPKPGNQWAQGISFLNLVYIDEGTSLPTVVVRNLWSGKETVVATGLNFVGATIFGRNIFYVTGAGSGDLYVYNLSTKQSRFLAGNVSKPSAWGNKVVWTEPQAGGYYRIRGFNLDSNVVFDIAAVNNGYQQSADISANAVTWLDFSGGKTQIRVKDLVTGIETVVTEQDGMRLSAPSISQGYITWVDSMGTGAHDVFAYNRRTQAILRLSDFGPQQASPTIPDLDNNNVVWMSWHTGSGDIYGAKLGR